MNYLETAKSAAIGAVAAVLIAGGVSMALSPTHAIPTSPGDFVPFGQRGSTSDAPKNSPELPAEETPESTPTESSVLRVIRFVGGAEESPAVPTPTAVYIPPTHTPTATNTAVPNTPTPLPTATPTNTQEPTATPTPFVLDELAEVPTAMPTATATPDLPILKDPTPTATPTKPGLKIPFPTATATPTPKFKIPEGGFQLATPTPAFKIPEGGFQLLPTATPTPGIHFLPGLFLTPTPAIDWTNPDLLDGMRVKPGN
jgi:hypothetical protein